MRQHRVDRAHMQLSISPVMLEHRSWKGARVKRGSSCMRDSAVAKATRAGGRSSC